MRLPSKRPYSPFSAGRRTVLARNRVFQGKAPLSAEVTVRIESVLPTISAEVLMVSQARAQVRAAREHRL